MSTYSVKIGAERIAFLTDFNGTLSAIADHVHDGADADTMVFDNRAMQALRELPSDSDGHVDDQHQMWFGGMPYEVSTEQDNRA